MVSELRCRMVDNTCAQGCPQDVKSQDRDKTETFHFFKLSRPRRDRDVEPSRPRWDRDVWFFQTLETETFNLQDQDATRHSKKRLETASRPRRSRPRLHPCLCYSGIICLVFIPSCTAWWQKHNSRQTARAVTYQHATRSQTCDLSIASCLILFCHHSTVVYYHTTNRPLYLC